MSHTVFNGNTITSPGTVMLFVMALFIGCVAPPVGMLLMIGAWSTHRRFRGKFRRADQIAAARVAEKRERDDILLFKSMAR